MLKFPIVNSFDVKFMINSRETLQIEDFIREVYLRGGAICGGFARYSMEPKEPALFSDIDIYPTTEKSFEYLSSFLYGIAFNKDFIRESDYNGVPTKTYFFRLPNDYNLSVQLIKLIDNPVSIIKNFDISITQAFLAPHTKEVFCTPQCWEDLQEKRFHYLKYPILNYDSALYRLNKYLDKGYNLSIEEIYRFYRNIEFEDVKQTFFYILKTIEESMSIEDKKKLLILERLGA